MTTTTGLPDRSWKAPVLAFGLGLVVSSGAGAVSVSTYPWTQTHVTELPAPMMPPAGTSTGVRHIPHGPSTATRSAADDVIAVRALSGLTTEQVAKVFGVTRRSVHNWIAGDAMAPHHRERLAHVLALVESVPGVAPDAKRATLLDSSRGPSLYHQLAADTVRYAAVQATVPSVRDRLHV